MNKYFKYKEFTCKDGTPIPNMYMSNLSRLVNSLTKIRECVNVPIIINSGYRTPLYNKKIGGASNSYHTKAMAADIRTKEIPQKVLFNIILFLMDNDIIEKGGLKCYDTFVHYDIRGHKVLF